MKNKLYLFLILICLIACAPSTANTAVTSPPIIQNYPLGSVEVRIHNNTPQDFDEITGFFGEERIAFGALEANSFTNFATVPTAFQSFLGEITISGESISMVHGEDIELSGEPPIVNGILTYTINFAPSDGLYWSDMRPEFEDMEARIQPLLEELRENGAIVQYEPSIQRPNLFQRLYGAPVAARELLTLNDERVVVYIFDDVETAVASAEILNQHQSTVTYIREDGTIISETPQLWSGAHPVWWQFSNLILLTDGREPEHHTQLTDAIRVEPLGGTVAEFIPTATPETPQLEGELYMARRNFDPDAFEEALLVGELVVMNDCLFVQGDGSTDLYLIIWPRLFTVDNSGSLPTVLDENGADVFQVGELAYLGGSSRSANDIERIQTQLVEPIPDRCLGSDIWSVGEVLPEEYRD
ncbi:MAG: hypothetical protein AAF490_06215 [Chloroflexota bacterium]